MLLGSWAVSEPRSSTGLISYAHESAERDRLVRNLADRLRGDGVKCEIDQYHDAPLPGWPRWMTEQIFDKGRFILVASSPRYARRWSLAEQQGVGLGAKWEGKLIRQVLYAEEGLNGRVIPIVFRQDDVPYIPPELQDTTWYDVGTDTGYDRLLRRLTRQPIIVPSPVGEPAALLEEQPAALASVFHLLQKVPAPLPVEMLCEAAGLDRPDLRAAVESPRLAPVLKWRDGDLLATTYYRPVHPQPTAPQDLLSRALDALLAYVGRHGAHAATRDQIRNALALAASDGIRLDVVARMFGVMQKALKRLGDKRLVWRAAALSLEATGRENRHEQDLKEEALTLICGRSWVLQRVNRLDEAKADAKRSLEIGETLKWHRNTCFCLKCLGRLSRMQADSAPDTTARDQFLADSERYLREAIDAFTRLDERDREDEVGECYSLLGRTLLVGGRLREGRKWLSRISTGFRG
jgi:hypothetical protein